MNKKRLMILVTVLAALAVVVTCLAARAGKVAAVDLSDPEKFRDTESDVSSAIVPVPDLTMKSAQVNLDELWQHSLFNPQRHEVEGADSSESAAEEQMNAEFELAGIAEVGLKDSRSPVAIIRARQKTSSNRGVRTSGNGRNNNQASQRQTGGKNSSSNGKKKAEAREKTVFKEGEVVGKTGYTLTGIYPEEKMVELTRGRDTIRLYIEYKSEQSAERRKNAANQEAAVRKAKNADSAEAVRPLEGTAQAGLEEPPAQDDSRARQTSTPRRSSENSSQTAAAPEAESAENDQQSGGAHYDNDNPNTPPPPPTNPRQSVRRNAKNNQ